MTNCSQIDFWKRHKVWRLERPKSWANLKCYAFPPNFVKICSDKPLVILIAPVWKLISHAFATSDRSSNPIASERQSSYIASKSASSFETQLAWKLSGDHMQTEAFLMKQPRSSVPHGPLGLINSTTQL